MARTLLQTYCILQDNGGFKKGNKYYNPDLRQQDKFPLEDEVVDVITCSGYLLPAGVELERYCTLVNGVGKMRVVLSDGAGNFVFQDEDSTECNGTCDLRIAYAGAINTTTTTATDGIIIVEATSSHYPIDCYIPTLGGPSITTVITEGYYQFKFTNVKPGTYSAQLQDNANCQKNTEAVTVLQGSAPGTGPTGLPAGITWLKYEYAPAGKNAAKIQGLAWDKGSKNGYTVNPITLSYPEFYQYQNQYLKGAIVGYVRSGQNVRHYYRALIDLIGENYKDNNRKIPYPDSNGVSSGYWERLTDGAFQGELDTIAYFQQVAALPNTLIVPQGTIVRYEYHRFYRAKRQMVSTSYPGGKLPAPTVGANNDYWEYVPNYSFFTFGVDEDQVVDQYQIGSITRRVRFHIANPAIQGDQDRFIFDDSEPAVEAVLGDLRVIDIIKNDVDNQGQENGSVWVMATSPALPIRYHLRNGVRSGYQQDNGTGIYENLHAGHYWVDIYDAENRYVLAEFDIEDRYKVRWKLVYDDLYSAPLETHILERDWQGEVTSVKGSGQPVVLSWDSGSDPAGYLPEAVGATLQFDLITQVAQQFVDTVLYDDRKHRVDHYRQGRLQFSGYIDATSYQERMLGPGQSVQVIATDGLGQLNNTKFINHLRERQEARTNMLSIILKCLSYCDVNLPLFCGINLRDKLMSADGDPLAEAFVNRNAYNKKDGKVIQDEDIIDCRTVVNSILRVFNAFLFQADGCWKIIALNEVHEGFASRAWSPAGTLLSDVDTSSAPLRILQSDYTTGERELFWIGANQLRTTVAAGQLVKAVVNLQLEENLFQNGDFVEWTGDNSRPNYWTNQGSVNMSRAKGEKAGEYAIQFSGYSSTFNAQNYLLSPPVPHLTGQDEDSMQLKFKAIVEPTIGVGDEVTATLYFQILCDGQPYGQPLEVTLESKDNWKEYSQFLPLGLPGRSVRLRVIQPVATQGTSTVRINYVALAIQPGLLDWSETDTDFVEVLNEVQTGKRLEDLELVHADLPLLPGADGKALPPKKMDVYAWRHAVSLQDFTATTAWKRPNYPQSVPLLDNAAQDRMAIRATPGAVVQGDVKGPGIQYLRLGLMLDMPQDVDGRFLIIRCFKNEREGTAEIVCRKLAGGDFGELPEVPDQARVATKNGKVGYRISYVSGVEGFRIASKE